MKAKYYILGLLGLALMGCGNKKTDWDNYDIVGKAKSVKSICYKAEEKFGELTEGDIESGADTNVLVHFDEDGIITDFSTFETDGSLLGKNINEIDDGHIVATKGYDNRGNLTAQVKYTYNDDGKVTEMVSSDADGTAMSTLIYEYDGEKLVKSQYINEYSDGIYYLYEYDGSDMEKSVGYGKDGKPNGHFTEYKDDKPVKIVTGKEKIVTTITYNDQGLPASITNGKIYSNNSIGLDEGDSFNYEYEYDDHGSWIRRVERMKDSGKATTIVVRTIEYY